MAYDDETGEELDVLCEEVQAEECINLLTKEWTTKVSIWANGEQVFPMPPFSGTVNGQIIQYLRGWGFHMLDVPEYNEAVLSYLLNSTTHKEKIYVHDQLGFHKVDGKTVFLANEVIGPFTKKSRYTKPKITSPCGSLKAWIAIVKREVIGHPHMELALAIGLVAPVAHLLQEAKLFSEVPIICLTGQSSTGKTTALRLMASVFGSPEEKESLIKGFNGTDTAIFTMLEGFGFPNIVDESTASKIKDFAPFIYNVSKGADKLRCNGDGSMKEQKTFSGAVVFSGEVSLLQRSTPNLGIYARIVELTLPWTDDAEHARRISQGVRQNYGWAVVPYISHLLNFQERPKRIEKAFNQELQQFRDAIGGVTGEMERVLNMYATVILSAKLFSKALGIKFSIKAIRNLLVETFRNAPKRVNLAQQLYETVLDEVALHGQYFPKAKKGKTNENYYIPTTLWGEHAKLNGKNVLWIVSSKFQEFASKNGFGNYTPYLQELSDAGLLKKYSGGYTTKHRLGDNEPRCYCLYT